MGRSIRLASADSIARSGARSRFVLALLGLALLMAAGAPSGKAAVEVPFAPRFAANLTGEITLAANTLMSCPAEGAGEAECLAARAGTATGAASSNNNYAMQLVDVDADAATFDSSRATLTLPAGATVRFAGLYYGARLSAGGKGGAAAPDPAARGTVLLQAPGTLGYAPLSASVLDSTGISAAYTGFADVTSIVAAAGSGEYTVANVQAGTGEDRYAGWSLVVAYSDPAAQPRSLRVYDGLASIVANEAPLQIAIDGLETPPSGAVSADVGVVAYEGDRSGVGDELLLNGAALADAVNPANNVFNSTIAFKGANVTAKQPDYANQLGFDADVLAADGILANGATAATLQESTRLEQYLTQVVAVSVQLDPRALEPPAPPKASPSPPTTPPAAPADHHKKKKKGEDKSPQAPVELSVEAPDLARPTEVVAYRVELEAGSIAARGVEVCNRLPGGLRRLRATGAEVDGAVACWHIGKLAPHRSRTLLTTAQVEVSGRATLRAHTVLRGKNVRMRRVSSKLRIVPVRESACGSSAAAPQRPGARARC